MQVREASAPTTALTAPGSKAAGRSTLGTDLGLDHPISEDARPRSSYHSQRPGQDLDCDPRLRIGSEIGWVPMEPGGSYTCVWLERDGSAGCGTKRGTRCESGSPCQSQFEVVPGVVEVLAADAEPEKTRRQVGLAEDGAWRSPRRRGSWRGGDADRSAHRVGGLSVPRTSNVTTPQTPLMKPSASVVRVAGMADGVDGPTKGRRPYTAATCTHRFERHDHPRGDDCAMGAPRTIRCVLLAKPSPMGRAR